MSDVASLQLRNLRRLDRLGEAGDVGLIYTTVRNNVLLFLYALGVSPATLKRWYR